MDAAVIEAYQNWRETAGRATRRLVTQWLQHTESEDALDGLLSVPWAA